MPKPPPTKEEHDRQMEQGIAEWNAFFVENCIYVIRNVFPLYHRYASQLAKLFDSRFILDINYSRLLAWCTYTAPFTSNEDEVIKLMVRRFPKWNQIRRVGGLAVHSPSESIGGVVTKFAADFDFKNKELAFDIGSVVYRTDFRKRSIVISNFIYADTLEQGLKNLYEKGSDLIVSTSDVAMVFVQPRLEKSNVPMRTAQTIRKLIQRYKVAG